MSCAICALTLSTMPKPTAPKPSPPADHREYVARGAAWSTGADVFRLLLDLGLRQEDQVLDVGCGALRVGRFLLTYLEPGCYVGVEPNQWLLDRALAEEVGHDLIKIKQAQFDDRSDFDMVGLGPFEGVLISAIFVHTDHLQMTALLQSSAQVLKPGGKIVCNLWESGPHEEREGGGWRYPEIYPHYFPCLRARLPSAFAITKVAAFGPQSWYVINRSEP